ncbi:MAG: hypothetical protein ACFFFK_05565 [Candidatus Thorarchaeota archaeon]
MPEFPVCPVCEYQLEDPIPESLEGSIKLKCPFCSQRFEYSHQMGSYPLEDDLGVQVAKGLLGPHVMTGDSSSDDDVSLTRALLVGGLCCCTLAIIIPVIVSLILSLF